MSRFAPSRWAAHLRHPRGTDPSGSIFLQGMAEAVGLPGAGKSTYLASCGLLTPRPSLYGRAVYRLGADLEDAIIQQGSRRFLGSRVEFSLMLQGIETHSSSLSTQRAVGSLRRFAGVQYLYGTRNRDVTIDDGWIQRITGFHATLKFNHEPDRPDLSDLIRSLGMTKFPPGLLIFSTWAEEALARISARGRYPSILTGLSRQEAVELLECMRHSLKELVTLAESQGAGIEWISD